MQHKKLSSDETLLVEAIESMLQQDAKLGLKIHDKAFKSMERGFEYLHNQIDDMFAIKAAELIHSESVCRAFQKVHGYKYLDDPTFKVAMEKEMVAEAVPVVERNKAAAFLTDVITELKDEQENWVEKDHGFHPSLDEIRKVSKPAKMGEFKIHNSKLNTKNVKYDPTDMSPSRTPSD